MANARRVSEIFNLGFGQGSLDFVDVDIFTDTALFLSPRALEVLGTDWGDECVHLVRSFFGEVMSLIKAGKNRAAEELLGELREPNETHLGLSVGKSRGRALGTESAQKVWEALSESEAAKSGLLKDLEDTALMIEGIGVDIISDVTTNIIRGPLIVYTQEMAKHYGIPLEPNVAAGHVWDPTKKAWVSVVADLPLTPEGKLLLVPKAAVRASPLYKAGDYYRHFVLTFLQEEEFKAGTSLVRFLRDGTPIPPSKKSLAQKYGKGKAVSVEQTLANPEILDRYRTVMKKAPYAPLSAEEIADASNTAPPDWDELLDAVLSVKPGKKTATEYERATEALFSALFTPDLAFPDRQSAIHNKKKIVDIRFTNVAPEGFFDWVANHYTAPHIWVECKNYSGEVANPELDQLSGRFSPRRGRVGILVCRNFDDKDRFLQRCRDTADDDRGYIIALDDDDLVELVRARADDTYWRNWPLLRERFNGLVN